MLTGEDIVNTEKRMGINILDISVVGHLDFSTFTNKAEDRKCLAVCGDQLFTKVNTTPLLAT